MKPKRVRRPKPFSMKAVLRIEYGPSDNIRRVSIPLDSCTDIKMVILNKPMDSQAFADSINKPKPTRRGG